MDRESRADASDQEWQNRVLCSDESCIGVIGPDGCCKECGRPFEGELPVGCQPDAALAGEDENDAQEEDRHPSADELSEDGDASISDDEWEQRKLCPDEACIGVIGPDGRCKECGKPSEA